ncbi:MAG: MarR family transcriptional regulator [Flavobacteriales bacterium]|nr:MarR family transcriptional regulator [Flavobacteriales bacterium]
MDEFKKNAELIIVHKIRSAWFEMSRIFNSIGSIYNISLPVGLTLMSIYEEEGTPVTKIAPRMGMEPNSLSRILKTMEKDAFVVRAKDTIDKRRVMVKLTNKGQEARNICLKSVYRMNDAMLEGLDPIKVKHFYEVMNSFPKSMALTLDEMLDERKA